MAPLAVTAFAIGFVFWSVSLGLSAWVSSNINSILSLLRSLRDNNANNVTATAVPPIVKRALSLASDALAAAPTHLLVHRQAAGASGGTRTASNQLNDSQSELLAEAIRRYRSLYALWVLVAIADAALILLAVAVVLSYVRSSGKKRTASKVILLIAVPITVFLLAIGLAGSVLFGVWFGDTPSSGVAATIAFWALGFLSAVAACVALTLDLKRSGREERSPLP